LFSLRENKWNNVSYHKTETCTHLVRQQHH